MLTHGNILANCRGVSEVCQFTDEDVSLSWMPLTHDMGLIGFHIFMFANRVHAAPDAHRAVRAPAAAVAHVCRARCAPRILCSPNFGYRHYLKVLGDRPVDGLDLSARAADLQRRRADLGGAVRGVPDPPAARAAARATPCSRSTGLPRRRWP